MGEFLNYEEWVKAVPATITGDPLWKVEVYRLSLFAADIGWHDVSKLVRDRRTLSLSDQLYRALGSISANAAEGYSRGTGKDRAHFYEYALGSARESRDWYYKARHVLGESVTSHRLALFRQIVRLLLAMVPQQRGYSVREGYTEYQESETGVSAAQEKMRSLLVRVPLP